MPYRKGSIQGKPACAAVLRLAGVVKPVFAIGFAQVFQDNGVQLNNAGDESCPVCEQGAVLRGIRLSAGTCTQCGHYPGFVVGAHERQDNDRFKPALVLIHFCFSSLRRFALCGRPYQGALHSVASLFVDTASLPWHQSRVATLSATRIQIHVENSPEIADALRT
jgi:hypothetical protein